MRRAVVIVIGLVAVAFLTVGGPSLLFSPTTDDVSPEQEAEPDVEVVSLEGQSGGFWPYLSARESHDQRSPINVIVTGDPDEVVRILVEEGEGDWEELEEEEDDHDNESDGPRFIEEENHHATGTSWGQAAGTTRYAWVDPGPGQDPTWTTETLQLEDGDYYGHRTHIRVYEAPGDDDWVAMQAHTEHFDWLTLRHRVDGVEEAQLAVEREFMELPGVDPQENVTRINLENDGPSDADGWATLVDLRTASASLVLLLGLALRRETVARIDAVFDRWLLDVDRQRLAAARARIEPGHITLLAATVGIVIGIRLAGITLERYTEALTMHMIAALLYPFLALGLPIATYLIARNLARPLDAALVGAGSLALAIWLDYGTVGVDSLPVDVVLQRMLLVVALGLIAGGAVRQRQRSDGIDELLVAGVGFWVVVLAATLFGYL